jgi:hypothetical protein
MTKYKKEPFEDYSHRFVIQFELKENYKMNESHFSTLSLYSDSESEEELNNFIQEKKSDKVISWEVVHRASKEQDKLTSEFIDETLKDI